MKKMIYVSIACVAIFLSCKKNDGSSETPTPKKVTRMSLYPENGYISGTIKSTTKDGTYFEKEFKHQLDLGIASYTVDEMGDYQIHFEKADKYGSVGNDDQRTEMSFLLSSDLRTIYGLSQLHSSIYVDSTAISITKFDIDRTSTSNNSMTVSNVVFDLTTGKLQANYSIETIVSRGISNVKALIVGKIDMKLTNVHYREGNL